MNIQQNYLSYKQKTSYGYASGRLRVMETRLLNRNAILRLLETDSAQETFRMLKEGDYANAFSNIAEFMDFDIGLKNEQEKIYALIDDLSLDPKLTSIFRARCDFHNLKVLFKASYVDESKSNNEALINFGTIPYEDLKLAIKPDSDKKSADIPEYISKALNDAKLNYESSKNPQMIDITIDNHCHSFMYNQALKHSNQFLCGYLQALADLNNIRNFVRIKMLKEGIRLLDSVILPFGLIEKKVFLQHFEDNVESFGSALSNTPYAELVTESIRKWADEYSLATFEKLTDNYLVNYIKPAKYIVFGIEPLIAYLLAKEHEIKLIRIIMMGKINGVPNEIINERLRDTYV